MKVLLLLCMVAVVAAGCSETNGAVAGNDGTRNDDTVTIPTKVEPATLEALKNRAVLFGHQSVGQNIMEGVEDLLKQTPGSIRVTGVPGTPDANQLERGTLLHTIVGTNGDPFSKIRAFADMMDSGLGEKADVALFKFCYIDVEASTDVDRLFQEYRSTLASLKERHPATTFVHVTMPLRLVQTGPKAVIKRTLGRPLGGYAENVLRNRYNQMLRAEYQGKQPFFDLAQVESTRPDGSRVTFQHDGQEFFALHPAFTPDNGHLNEQARIMVAGAFLNVLATDASD
jgi:hypothetical protein